MITPMLDAQNDSCPLIVFSGNVPKKNMGTNAFQEAPAIDITKPFTKWSYCLNSIDELEDVCDEDNEHELAFDLIKEQQLKHCIEVADLQKQIDKNPFEKSVRIMRKNSNEEMLSRKYDRLFNKKTKEVK